MASPTKCPVCLRTEHVLKIFWGMPSGEEDPEKFYIGGCLVDENPDEYICISCIIKFGQQINSKIMGNP